MPPRNNPTLADVLRAALDSRLSDLHVALPARVERYDSARQAVSVKPLIRTAVPDAQLEDDEQRAVESLPVINGVPVVFPGAGPYSITFPIAKGDTGLLIFSEASLDKWKSDGREVDPLDDRRHSLSDAVFIPGLRALGGKAAPPVPADGVAAAAMVLRGAEIQAGGTKELVTRDEFRDFVDNYYKVHTHPAPGGTTSAASVGTAVGTLFPGTSILKGG